MVALRLPDGTVKQAATGATSFQVAESIGKRLAQAAVAAKLDGEIVDLMRDRAKKNLHEARLASRCQAIAGNFFEAAPPGGDAYMMRHIIHDWTDEQCHTILSHCHAKMPTHGRLLIVEMVIKPGNEPQPAKWLDLNVLLLPGGQERTQEEYRMLLAKAGFRLERIVPTLADVSVIEGKRI